MEKKDHTAILIIDDDKSILSILVKHLRLQGYQASTASDGSEGLAKFAVGRFDLILLDINMPNMDGLETLRRVKQADENISVLIMTGYGDMDIALDAIRFGAFDFIRKPFDLKYLNHVIANGIDRTQLLWERQIYTDQLLSRITTRTIELNKRQEKIDEFFIQTISALANAMDAKDQYTIEHSRRVAEFSNQIGEEMGLSASSLKQLHVAAILHDIGKIGIPDEVLLKEGRLNDEEFAIIRSHPSKSANILVEIDDLYEVAMLVRYHHEHWDGSGYPVGLVGDEIPLGSQIITTADAFDAMTSTRPYRKGLTIDMAKEEIIRYSGTSFAPEVVKVLAKLIDDSKIFILNT
ncbi:MAG: HD domain-containing phosphohydrolase [Nitrospinota bacterium]